MGHSLSNSVNNFLYDNYALMAGCLDTVKMPNMEWLETTLRDRRNLVASISSGVLFFFGWWLAIDAAACYTDKNDLKDVFHICGVFGTISMFMVNAVSNGQLTGEAYTTGCLGANGVRIWIFFGEYVTETEGKTFHPKSTYPGVAIFLQNACIFFASLIYKFGRSEDLWG